MFLSSGRALCSALDLRCRFTFTVLGFAVLGDIDTAFEICPVFDHDTGGLDISDDRCACAQRNAALRFDVALNGAKDDDFRSLDVGIHFAVRPDGQAVAKVQLTVEVAIQVQLFIAGDLADDLHGFTKHRCGWSRRGRLTWLVDYRSSSGHWLARLRRWWILNHLSVVLFSPHKSAEALVYCPCTVTTSFFVLFYLLTVIAGPDGLRSKNLGLSIPASTTTSKNPIIISSQLCSP